eukprot:8062920-Karenia_brevis.AAC.1
MPIRSIQEERSECKTVVDEAPKKVKGSNGRVERAVQEIERRIRSILLSLEERLGRDVDAKERIVAFIPAYAAYLYNRPHKGEDGKVAYERVQEKRPTVVGVEFGEEVFYMRQRGARLEKINPRMEYGIFVETESQPLG